MGNSIQLTCRGPKTDKNKRDAERALTARWRLLRGRVEGSRGDCDPGVAGVKVSVGDEALEVVDERVAQADVVFVRLLLRFKLLSVYKHSNTTMKGGKEAGGVGGV